MKIKNIPPTYLFISIIIIATVYFLFPSYELIKYPFNLIGIIFILFGGMMSGKSAKTLKKHGAPMNLEKKSTTVVQEGFFSYSRNPMYLGMILLLVGLSILSKNILSFTAPVFCCLIVNFKFISDEEKKMEADLGKEYLEYKSKVRRWF
jgi:protein-S-isoprenylcysteine O-methyltransferase Ste14